MSRRWQVHKGGGIPAELRGVAVDVEFRDGDLGSYPDAESLGGWDHEDSEHDVVRYRIKYKVPTTPALRRRSKQELVAAAIARMKELGEWDGKTFDPQLGAILQELRDTA